MAQGHEHAGGHEPKPAQHKPHREEQREQAVHQQEQQKHGQHRSGTAPNALEKAVRGHAQSEKQQKPDKQQKHEKDHGGTAPNALEKAVQGHAQGEKQQHEKGLHPEKQHAEKQTGAAPNAFDKGLREQQHHKPQHAEKPQLDDKQKHTEKQAGAAAPNAFDKRVREQHQQDARKGDPVSSKHDQAVSPKESEVGNTHSDAYWTHQMEKMIRESPRLGSTAKEHMLSDIELSKGVNQSDRHIDLTSLASRAEGHVLPTAPDKQDTDDKSLRGHQPQPQEKQQHDPLQQHELDKSTRELQQPQHDKQQHYNQPHYAEQTRAIAPNALEKSLRAHRDESKKDDPTRPQHDQILSSKEREERLRIATPAEGVGFQFGSAQLVPGMIEQWLASQPEQLRTALSDPAAKVFITASASRSGSNDSNLQLTVGRGDSVQQWLRDHGVQASIEIHAVGEEPAKQVGKPDGVDDASDRVAKIEIIPANKMERSIDLAQLLQEANAAITDYARTHGELAPFVKSDIFGYEYRKDTIIGREELGKPSTDHVAAMTALKFYPEAFFPFHVVSKNNIKSIVLGGEYDLVSRIDSPRLPPGNNPVRVTEVTPTSFTFTTLEGHFDPPGSTITFTTWVDSNRNIHLEQYGRAKSFDPSSTYLFAPKVATIVWDEQAANLRNWLESGGLSPSHIADPWK